MTYCIREGEKGENQKYGEKKERKNSSKTRTENEWERQYFFCM
jgi:hypothetical protein